MSKKLKIKPRKKIGYRINLTVDGKFFDLFVTKRKDLNNYMSKQHLEGIQVSFTEVFDS